MTNEDLTRFYEVNQAQAKDFARLNEEGKIDTKMIHRLVVSDMTTLTTAQIEALECGDIVIKNQKGNCHAYIVSYKEHHQGICITYTDASTVETVSYDYVEGNWVYNSTDIASLESN